VPNVAADLCRPSHGDRSTASGPSAGRAAAPMDRGRRSRHRSGVAPPTTQKGRRVVHIAPAAPRDTAARASAPPVHHLRRHGLDPVARQGPALAPLPPPDGPLPPSRQRRHPGGGRAARAVRGGAAADRRAGAGRDHCGHQRPRNPALEDVCNEFAGQLIWTWTPVASKRNAVRIGVEMASGEVVVLLDSDTIWTEGTLAELLTPFADPPRGRRDHQAAHPRPRAQPPHPVGGLAGEQGPAEPSRSSRTRHHRRPGTNL
jgi:hypothetical protein